MVKIGKSAGQSSSKSPSNEDSPWRKFTLALVDVNANNWFAAFEPRTLSEIYPSQTRVDDPPYMLSHAVKQDMSLVEGFAIDYSLFSEALEIPETKLGRAVQKFLTKRGVTMNFRTMWAVTHELSTEVYVRIRLEGQWGTVAGTPFLQSFEIRKDKTGKEVGFWFVNLLASPLTIEDFNHFEVVDDDGTVQNYAIPDSLLEKGGWTIGQLSTKVNIPLFAKQLAFMSETPFPSTQFMQISRDMAFSKVPHKARPKPFFSHMRNEFVQSFSHSLTRDQGSGVHMYEGTLYPEVIQFGWSFGRESINYLEEILPVVIDGCSYAVTTVEDGFENYRDLSYAAPWDDVVASPLSRLAGYETRGSRLGAPQWIPLSHIGEIQYQTKALYLEAMQHSRVGEKDQALEKLRAVVSDGAGPFLVHGINSLCYSHLLPRLFSAPGEIDYVEFLTEEALSLEMHEQSTNALCNLGIAYFIIGDLERSEITLKAALERPDKFSEDEASYFLAVIAEARGRESEASEYRKRCTDAGGYEAPSWLIPATEIEPGNIGHSTAAPRGLFCTQCGTKFTTDSAKFCANCGAQRVG